MHQKYDLKGSTYKRKANKYERGKNSPTFKDLDFMEHHADGILLEAETYKALITTIERDCRVLASFKIMDYSLLVGIHNLDLAAKQKTLEKERRLNGGDGSSGGEGGEGSSSGGGGERGSSLTRSRSINRHKLVAHSTAMESIQADSDPIDEEDHVPPGGIPARNAKGERLLLFIGVIDILQSYRLKKKLEHTFKSMIHDGDTISVHRPNFYAQRFLKFMEGTVFKKIPSPLRHSPSRRRGPSLRAARPTSQTDPDNPLPITEAAPQESHEGVASLRITGSDDHTDSGGGEVAATVGLPLTAIPGSGALGMNNPITVSCSGSIAGGSSGAPSTPVNLPSVLQDRPHSGRGRMPPPVPPRSPRGSCSQQGVSHHPSFSRGSGRGGVVTYSAPGAPPGSTPPPPWDNSSSSSVSFGGGASSAASSVVTSSPRIQVRSTHTHVTTVAIQEDRTDVVSVSDVRLEPRSESRSTLSVDSSVGGPSPMVRTHTWTPPLSVEGSTPTWTEGTPSFTESSSSGDLGCPTTPVRSLNTTQESTENFQETEITHL